MIKVNPDDDGDYSSLEQRALANMGRTGQTLFEQARALVNAAQTPAERNLRKRDLFRFLYGNPQPLKDALAVPFKEVK